MRKLRWNYRDNIASATVIERNKDSDDVEYYVYDSAGQRIRKVSETLKAGGIVEIAETIYLGGVEIKRIKTKKKDDISEMKSERWSFHVNDGHRPRTGSFLEPARRKAQQKIRCQILISD
jgi:hypothetical protein